MSPRKLLILTAVVLVLFGFIILFERKMPTTAERQEKGDLVWDLPQDRVESLRLEQAASAAPIELKKGEGEGAGWRLIKPEPYAADSTAVNDVVSQLTRLRRSGGDSGEARPEDYGLQTPSAKATLVWRDPSDDKKRLTRTIEFGIDIPGTDAAAARVAGSNKVFFVLASVAASVRKKPDDFKSKDVFGSASADANRLDVERGRGRLSLSRKNGIWWLIQPLSDLADAEAVQRLVGELTSLKVLEFLPGSERQNLASLGLAPPLYRVTLGDPKTASTVDIGSTRSDGNSVYGRRENQVFTLPSTITEELSREAEAFRDPHLTHLEAATVTGITGTFGPKILKFERQGGGWMASGKPIAATAMNDLLTAIQDLKSRSFLDDASADALKNQPPRTSVDVSASSGPSSIRIYASRDGTRATVAGRPGAFAMAEDPSATLEAAFDKAATSPAPTAAPISKK